MDAHETKDRPILFFIGVIFLLLGLYGALKVVVNLVAFDRYPQESVFSLPFSEDADTYSSSYQREEECALNYSYTPTIYYEEDGTIRSALPPEAESDQAYKTQQEMNAQSCVIGIQEIRKATLVNDISQSAIFFLFAIGILVFSRVFRKALLTIRI